MGRSNNSNGGKKQKKKNIKDDDSGMIWVDPVRVRFQHSRIRPHFSGCGRSILETLESIQKGELSPSDLPPIQVIAGPDDWFFSLNNRRLWVLKQCRDQGLLQSTDHQIQVRVRSPKSSAEAERYTLEKCALEAKVMKEPKTATKAPQIDSDSGQNDVGEPKVNYNADSKHLVFPTESPNYDDEDSDDDDDDDDDDDLIVNKNPFSALM
jgi:hypothetical protein